ncbi:MAG: hypothetical protein NTW52_14420 [Planctomycetota bacterium]|nr:hypothetical protein [Planctomycetota bacterium]
MNPYESINQHEQPASPLQSKSKKTLAFNVTLALFCLGSIFTCLAADWFVAGLLFIPFVLGPLLINLSQTSYWLSKGSQAVLMTATIAYAIWFAYVYSVAIIWGTDAQSPIALLFIGAFSLPVMVPLWIVAGILNWQAS